MCKILIMHCRNNKVVIVLIIMLVIIRIVMINIHIIILLIIKVIKQIMGGKQFVCSTSVWLLKSCRRTGRCSF